MFTGGFELAGKFEPNVSCYRQRGGADKRNCREVWKTPSR
jgi:hypothetical protein